MNLSKTSYKTPMIAKVLNAMALLAFAGSILYLLFQWSSLPDQVPTHYNAAGEPDDWGGKSFILIPPMIGLLIWVGSSFLEKRPQYHNYIGINEENRERLYKNSSHMLNILKNEILLFFSFGILNDIRVANGKGSLLGSWELPLFLILIFGTIAVFVIRMFRLQR
ncbi:DUF1648 domain-containing protein [Mesobacillus zeae]|uniref:DUF1648 domain-containing protein n=1 Tax=Mesobacillus zeae TaxID=1917180 RepID=A0A398B787_9BACI|nr:DUF1648 domain-containing protein [Mesobacillus zeae]RID83583.1 DUF1648 domain-containing protein [Mesobacillus zeae]